MNYILQRLDQGYHSSLYQDLTRQFPLRMPDSYLDRLTEEMIKNIKKNYGFILDEIKDPNEYGNVNFKKAVHEVHIPSARNWTRGVNGIMQATMLIGLSIFMRRIPASATQIVALSWGSAGARHLYTAEYTDEERKMHRNNARFVWEKPRP